MSGKGQLREEQFLKGQLWKRKSEKGQFWTKTIWKRSVSKRTNRKKDNLEKMNSEKRQFWKGNPKKENSGKEESEQWQFWKLKNGPYEKRKYEEVQFWKWKSWKRAIWKRTSVKKQCEKCSNEFKCYPSDNRRYCSRKCFETRRLPTSCLECNNKFYIPGQVNQKYCSKECYYKNVKGTFVTSHTTNVGKKHSIKTKVIAQTRPICLKFKRKCTKRPWRWPSTIYKPMRDNFGESRTTLSKDFALTSPMVHIWCK